MQKNDDVLVSRIKESDTGNPKYDGGYKAELSNKTEFLHFLKKYVGADWAADLTEADVELCEKEFILEDFRRRAADLLYKIHLNGQDIYVYLIMELQSSVDFTMPLRILTYVFSLQLKIFLEEKVSVRERKDYRLPIVVPVVFYNGDEPWSAVMKFSEYQNGYQDFGSHIIDFEYYLVDLTCISNEYILSTNSLIDNILAIDKSRWDASRFDQMLDQIGERMSGLSPEDKISFSKWLNYVILAAIGEDSRESIHLLIQRLKGDERKMMHGLQMRLIAELNASRKEGEEQGLKQGLALGNRTGIIGAVASTIKKASKKGLSRAEIYEFVDMDQRDFERICDALEMNPEISGYELSELILTENQSS